MRRIHRSGAPCTVLIEGQKQKLSARGQEGIFLGVNPTSQGYYVLNQTNNAVTTSRNVCVHDEPCEEYYPNNRILSRDTTNQKNENEPEMHSAEQTVKEEQTEEIPVATESVEHTEPQRKSQ